MDTAPVRPGGEESTASEEVTRPLRPFLLVAFGLAWPILSSAAVSGLPFEPFVLVVVYVALLAPALWATRRADGPGGTRRLLRRAVLVRRAGALRWLVVVGAIPLITVAIALGTGTFGDTDRSVPVAIGWYLLETLLIGALVVNLAEELAWGGFVQTRLTARHGLLGGALLTAPVFAAVHIPLAFPADWTPGGAAVTVAVLFGIAPFYRYLLGLHLLDTGGSVLVIAVQHASWNASNNIEGVEGEWQAIVATGLLALLVAVGRRVWRPETRVWGREAERAAAADWLQSRG